MAEKDAAAPRKILHIDTSTNWRGPQAQLHLLVKGMHARGLPVYVACPVESPLWEAVEFLGERRITISADLSERTAAQVFRAQPDLVAAHTLSGYASVAGLPLPLVLHRTLPDLPPGAWATRRPDGFIVNSDMVLRALRRAGIRNAHVVREGVEPLAEPTGPALDAPSVLVAETPPGHSDAELMRTTASLMEGVDFGVLGKGPATVGGVRWMGNRLDASNLFEGAQCFLQMSLQDGLATQVVQAMLIGLPVIVSDAEGLPDVVGDCGVIVPQNQPKKLVEAIRAVLAGGHPSLDAARERAATLFGTEPFLTRTLQVYSGVIKACAHRWGGAGA